MIRPSEPRYRLRNPQLLPLLMEAANDGAGISLRGLADITGTYPGQISKLISGQQGTLSHADAAAIAGRLGCDINVIWRPAQRADAYLQAINEQAKASA